MGNSRASVKIFGHRGAASLAPENTIASIERALADGADAIECDVRITADGVPVLLHDARVDRTTDGSGEIAELSFEEVRRLDAGAGFATGGTHPFRGRGLRVPTLEEGWRAGRRRLVLEIKGSSLDDDGGASARRAATAVAAFLAASDHAAAIVTSFDPGVLGLVRERVPGVATGVLTTAAFDALTNIAAAGEGGHGTCFLPDAVVDPEAVAVAHAAGLAVVAWTVNDPDRLRALAAMGIDGVISDDPGAARIALARGPGLG